MYRRNTDQEKLFRLAAVCQNAIQHQHDRHRRLGYGIDDYTDGRLAGAAELARTILRILTGGHAESSRPRIRPRGDARRRLP